MRWFPIKSTAVVATLSLIILLAGASAAADHGKILYAFNGNDGADPNGGLISDANGNLYGTTYAGGTSGAGVIFEVVSPADGGWKLRVLHNFSDNAPDGGTPTAGLILDRHGNFYGTTFKGGAAGLGTVFELSCSSIGHWTEHVLYSFQGNSGGANPYAGLVMDSLGNIYGTTLGGGNSGQDCESSGCGTVFQLAPTSTGWQETILYKFTDNGVDGINPTSGLILDQAGNLYGDTASGGSSGAGTVFELTSQSGEWVENILHSFAVNGVDGIAPSGPLVFDANGNLYGLTFRGGAYGGYGYGYGTAFELSPGSDGWTETILFNFGGTTELPTGPAVFDARGNIYGVAVGAYPYAPAIVFELTPWEGSWSEAVLGGFAAGNVASGALLLDKAANIYGALGDGGPKNDGAVYELTGRGYNASF
jgi:uncharacterized repeat protein (TIGR03803 family)